MINLKTIEGLDYIRNDKNGLKIGAHGQVDNTVKSPGVKEEYKLLAAATHSVSLHISVTWQQLEVTLLRTCVAGLQVSPQYRRSMVCLRRGGKYCSALAGDNRYHSIFGAVGSSRADDVSDDVGFPHIRARFGRVASLVSIRHSSGLGALDADITNHEAESPC